MSTLGYIDFSDMNYEVAQLSPPWGYHVAPHTMLALFVLKKGSAWLQTDSKFLPCVEIHEGDIVGVSSGVGYTISSTPDLPKKQVVELGELNQQAPERKFAAPPENAPTIEMMIGRVTPTKNTLVGIYPVISIISPEDGGRYNRATSLLELIASEYVNTDRKSSPAILKRLTEVLAIELIENVEQKRAQGDAAFWYPTTSNRKVAKALDLLHQDFQKDWTLESLAREVGCSRSVLAENFRSVTGVTAIAYLTSIRINRAITLIEGGPTTLGEVAHMVGYQSEAGFSRAFLREIGITPGHFRTIDQEHGGTQSNA